MEDMSSKSVQGYASVAAGHGDWAAVIGPRQLLQLSGMNPGHLSDAAARLVQRHSKTLPYFTQQRLDTTGDGA